MKQTVTTKNYTTTVDIPLEKLASKCNHVKYLPPSQNSSSSVCHNYQICCTPCYCNKNSQQKSVSMQQIEQLQKLYEQDVQQLNASIQQYKQRCIKLQSQLEIQRSNGKHQREQVQRLNKRLEQTYQQHKKNLSDLQINNKQQQNKLLNMKIREFESRNLISQRKHEQMLVIMENKHLTQLQNLTLSYKNKIQRINEDQVMSEKLYKKQLQSVKNNYQNKIGELINQCQKIDTNYKNKSQQLLKLQEQYTFMSNQYKNQIQNHKNTLNSLQSQYIQQKQRAISLYNLLEQQKKKAVHLQNSQSILYSEQLQRQIIRQQQLKKQYSNTIIDKRLLQQKYNQINDLYQKVQQQLKIKTNLLNQKQEIINTLRSQLATKQDIKNYEVKIERVIDRSQYIKKLEDQLQKYKYQIQSGKQLHQKYQLHLKQKQRLVRQLRNDIEMLRVRIQQLQAYIQKKQKSFQWIVQRQILKDIRVSQSSQIKPTYKVFQMKQTQFRDNQESINISINRQMLGQAIKRRNISQQQVLSSNFQPQNISQSTNYQYHRQYSQQPDNTTFNEAAMLLAGQNNNLNRN